METMEQASAVVEAARKAEIVESVRQAYDGPADGQPNPAWIRGTCPHCGAPVVSNAYYIGGRGYKIIFECWESLRETPACTYRKVL